MARPKHYKKNQPKPPEKEKPAVSEIVIQDTAKEKKKIKGMQISKMKGVSPTRKKSISLIAKEIIKNPLSTNAEIAKATGLHINTVATNKGILSEYVEKDERIMYITEKDLQVVLIGQEEIMRRLGNKTELKKMKTLELAQTIEKSEKRYMILRGEMTNKEGGLKQIDNIEII